MDIENDSRRDFLRLGIIGLGSAFLLDACANQPVVSQNAATPANKDSGKDEDEDANPPDEKEVTAVEDLMREHGVLRRALLIYSEAALRLRKDPTSVSPDALQKTAKLFRAFGEDYHEKKLEEGYLFPLIKQKNKDAEVAKYPDILIAQHARGREITEYILSTTNAAKIGAKSGLLADTLDGFSRMYQNHAAREDTIVFPAWKGLITGEEYEQLNDTFENIEHQQFGEDGFEDAVKQIGEIEESLGLSDISIFTPSPMN
jgi:hemerythrin-like domain-containing protein